MGHNSTVGFLYTGRVGDGYFNHVLGAESCALAAARPFPGKPFIPTEYPEATATTQGLQLAPFSGYAIYGNFRHDSRNLIYVLSYEDLGSDFRADFGLVPRVDTRTLTLNIHPQLPGANPAVV